jgi:hypothetical protein
MVDPPLLHSSLSHSDANNLISTARSLSSSSSPSTSKVIRPQTISKGYPFLINICCRFPVLNDLILTDFQFFSAEAQQIYFCWYTPKFCSKIAETPQSSAFENFNFQVPAAVRPRFLFSASWRSTKATSGQSIHSNRLSLVCIPSGFAPCCFLPFAFTSLEHPPWATAA